MRRAFRIPGISTGPGRRCNGPNLTCCTAHGAWIEGLCMHHPMLSTELHPAWSVWIEERRDGRGDSEIRVAP